VGVCQCKRKLFAGFVRTFAFNFSKFVLNFKVI